MDMDAATLAAPACRRIMEHCESFVVSVEVCMLSKIKFSNVESYCMQIWTST